MSSVKIEKMSNALVLCQRIAQGEAPDGAEFELMTNVSNGMPFVRIGDDDYHLDIQSFIHACLEKHEQAHD